MNRLLSLLLVAAGCCFGQRVVGGGQINSVSGSGATLVTTTGTQTANTCVVIDSNGNHVSSGAACASGPVVNTVNGNSGAVTLTTANLISTYTFATLPTCAVALKNVVAFVSDVGDLGSYWTCLTSAHENAYQWRPIGGRVQLAVSAIPFILPSSGSIGNNGALTLTTALPRIYSNGCYMYFPASAISTGSAAGVYWTVMSSTTAGTIYNNPYTSGLPAAPASTTAFATTGPGAYTQTTGSYLTMAQFTITGGIMGARGELWITSTWESAATTNQKIAGSSWNGSPSLTFQVSSSSTPNWHSQYTLRNAESVSSQISASGWTQFGGSGAFNTFTANTASNVALNQIARMATATDYLVEETWSVELVRP